MDKLLIVKPGEIIFFNTKEGKLISMMVSLGNGLFSSLEKKIINYVLIFETIMVLLWQTRLVYLFKDS